MLKIEAFRIQVSERVAKAASVLFRARAPLSSRGDNASRFAQASLDLGGNGRSYALLRAAQVLLIEHWWNEEPDEEMTKFLEKIDQQIEDVISDLLGGERKRLLAHEKTGELIKQSKQ